MLAGYRQPNQHQTFEMNRSTWLAGFSFTLAIGAMTFIFLIHSAYLSFKMNQHFVLMLSDPGKYIEKMASADEMKHPLLGQVARDTFLAHTAQHILALDDQEAIHVTCEQLKELNRRFNSVENKKILQSCKHK
jgi:hypothetical protein